MNGFDEEHKTKEQRDKEAKYKIAEQYAEMIKRDDINNGIKQSRN